MEKNKLQAVIFDLDGVITDSAKYHYLAWKELADELSIPFDHEYNENLKGISRMESLEKILENSKEERIYTEDEKLSMTEKKNDSYKELIKQITTDDILPGIHDFLKELKKNDIHIGLASVSKNATFILGQLGLEEYFEYVADAAKVKNAKPFPDLFLACMDYFGLAKDNCIGVEDARAGIEAIHRAGMKAVGVGTRSEMEDADLILTTDELSLNRILEAFELQ